ncbi:MAG: hypothetical protein NUV82_01330 [Candidatus Komeilibacteria bacterium]|nr:hypothetical protein [Candidatus Komeilibacteria bacterium]
MLKESYPSPAARGSDGTEQKLELEDTKEQLSAKADNFLKSLLHDKPLGLIDDVADKLKDRRFGEVGQIIERCPNISEYKELMLGLLEKQGYLEKKDDHVVVDLDKLRDMEYGKFKESIPTPFAASNRAKSSVNTEKIVDYFNNSRKSTAFYYTFRDTPVISRDDYQQGLRQGKPLFYIPQTEESIYDVDAIRKDDSYFAPWEIFRMKEKSGYTHNGQEADADLLRLMYLLYHPNYGDGRREGDKLKVRYADGTYRPISANFFQESYSVRLGNVQMHLSPRKALATEEAKEIVGRGFLSQDDFERTRVDAKKPHALSAIKGHGYVSLYGHSDTSIRYYVGKGEIFSDAVALKVSSHTGVALRHEKDGGYKLSHYFNLTNPEDNRLLVTPATKTTSTPIYTATKEITQTQPFVPGSKEIEKYADRGALLKFSVALEAINAVKRSIGVDILNLLESTPLWNRAIDSLSHKFTDTGEIEDFIKRYGTQYLATFLTSDASVMDFGKYMAMADNLEEKTAQKIVEKYGEILSLLQSTELEIFSSQDFDEEGPKKGSPFAEIKRRAKNILLEFSDKAAAAKSSGEPTDYIDLINQLETVESEAVLTASIVKSGEIAWEDVEGIDLRCVKEVPAGLQRKFEAIIKRNYGNTPFANKVVLQNLKEAFANSQENDFYTLSKGDSVLAFLRLAEINDEEVYFGSFNVNPDAQRAKISELMLSGVLDRVAESKKIIANVELDKTIAQKYINGEGFVVKNILMDGAGTGQKGLTLYRDDKMNSGLISKQPKFEFSGQKNIIKQDIDLNNEDELIAAQELLADGYVITRYTFIGTQTVEAVFEIAD